MKVLILYGPRDLRVEEIDDPIPPRGWVRIRVKRVGICGTDKAFYIGSYKLFKTPLIPGHEIAGVIDLVGDGVSSDLIGHRTTTEINVYCGRCWYCRHGMPTHCPYRETIGITRDGGMAEYVLTRANLVHVVDDLDYREIAFIEPLAAVIEATEMYPIKPLSRIAVLGIGTIGLLSIAYLKLFNPAEIIAVARPGSPKAKYAIEMGADQVLDYESALEYVRKYTPEGQGFDVIVEATGDPRGLDMAINIVRPRGVVLAKSTHGAPVSFNYTLAVVKEVQISTSRCGPFEKAVDLLRKKLIKVDRLVTGEYKLVDGREAFEKSFDRNMVKIHLIP
ncbi:MAG: alcohol dehydrogenase catalytic domain-containing protein [Thermoprotei archaeon]